MKRVILVWIVLLVFFSGCVVSKKKYETVVGERDLLERRLNETRSDLENAMTDFEAMKYELHKSNALKSDKVAELFAKSEECQEETQSLKKDLEETRKRYRSQQATSTENANELDQLRKRISQLAGDTASLQYSLSMSKARQVKLREEFSNLREKYNLLSGEHAETKNELEQTSRKISVLQNQLVEKTQTLSNVSDAFIELRKQLLSAKSGGTPIDPNQNKNIDRIARLLDHY